jgi:AcrR family transcriptional regulator
VIEMASRTRGGGVGRGVAGGSVDRGGGRSGVAEIQRARMITALVEVTGEFGVGGVTVARIVACSGVSRRTFYELFEDREDCFLAAFDQAVERARERVLPAFGAGGSWRERVRGALGALLEFLDDEPGIGALCVVDALAAGPAALERRARVVGALIDAVDEGRAEARGSAHPTRLTAEGVVGAVLAVLHARLSGGAPHTGAFRANGVPAAGSRASASRTRGSQARGASSMVALLGPLMGMIVLPYQGQAAAAREASRPATLHRRAPAAQGDPLLALDMRLTYRTVRVLLAIAAHPAGSNRRVADASGVTDQGQVSKLLARLERLGLLTNEGEGHTKGEPNAWVLTARGEQVARSIRAHSHHHSEAA